MSKMNDYQFWMLRIAGFFTGLMVLVFAFDVFENKTVFYSLSILGALAILVAFASYVADPYRLKRLRYGKKDKSPHPQEDN